MCKVLFLVLQKNKTKSSGLFFNTRNIRKQNKMQTKFCPGTSLGRTLGKILVCLLSFVQKPLPPVLLPHLSGSFGLSASEHPYPSVLQTFSEEPRLHSRSYPGIRMAIKSMCHLRASVISVSPPYPRESISDTLALRDGAFGRW